VEVVATGEKIAGSIERFIDLGIELELLVT
jgi:hypothetical protein